MNDQRPSEPPTSDAEMGGGAAFEVVNVEGSARVLLLCDHASRHVPDRYDGLGLDGATRQRHIAWDIGAADVTRRLVQLLDAPAVVCRTSRLVIDCNRPLDDPTSIVTVSDGVVVPGNLDVDETEAGLRRDRYFEPYHHAIGALVERFTARAAVPAIVPIHSFTPVMDSFERPWHIGVLWDRDPRLATRLMASLRQNPTVEVGDNEPYSGADPSSYSVQRYGRDRGRPHGSIEIRQDLIDTPRGVETWSHIVADALRHTLDDEDLFREVSYG